MLIEIIHVNGMYDPNLGTHVVREGGDRESYYQRVAEVVGDKAAQGADVLYRPNFGSAISTITANPYELNRALETDPFLKFLEDVENVTILPDGLGVPLEVLNHQLQVEDILAQRAQRVVVLGAYTTACVSFVADNVKSRNPSVGVGVDGGLSIDNGYRVSLQNPVHYATLAKMKV